MCGLRRIEGHDGSDSVRDAVVVDERRVEWFGKREAAERLTLQIEHRRRAARDVLAIHEQNEDEIDAVTMHAFGRRMTCHVGTRFDPELMSFNMPHPRVISEMSCAICCEITRRSS